MNQTHDLLSRAHRALRLARTFAIGLAVAACGGVDSGGTGAPTYASGTITGFGSVIVGGVHFDDSIARVTDADGRARSRDDLRLGMTTEIRGSAVGVDAIGTSVSTADSIVFGSALLGPVAGIDANAGRLVVLGQGVDIAANTVFDATSLGGGLAALAAGDIVEVYALYDSATNRYSATRIERKTATTGFALRGVVTALDTTAKTFVIGGQRVSYAALGAATTSALAIGNIVRVPLLVAQVGGVWQATGVTDAAQRPTDRDAVRLEGLVNAFVSATQFSVDGVAVDASGAAAVGVALGARVEVQGTARGAVLVASRVDVKNPSDAGNEEFELRGTVASPDAASLSFVVRGVTIVYSATTTDFRGGTPAQLAVGTAIEVRGRLSADRTRLLATRVVFR